MGRFRRWTHSEKLEKVRIIEQATSMGERITDVAPQLGISPQMYQNWKAKVRQCAICFKKFFGAKDLFDHVDITHKEVGK